MYTQIIVLLSVVQEDDGIPAAAEFAEGFIPDNSQAQSLPHKQVPESTRYAEFPSSSGHPPQPPAAKQGVSCYACRSILYYDL